MTTHESPRSATGANAENGVAANTDGSASPNYVHRLLSPEHLIDLIDNHAITIDVLQAVNARDCGRGVEIDWADGSTVNSVGRIDRDKRRPDNKGKIKKVIWPKGETTNLSMARRNGSDDVLVIEGFCQHLAVASWAPEQFDVFGMNGCDGIHGKTDLTWANGKRVVIGCDADRRTKVGVQNGIKSAARHLFQAGAEKVSVIDLPVELIEKENDGPDDVLARMPEEDRTAAVASWIESAKPLVKIDPNDRFSDAAMAGVFAETVFHGEVIWAAGIGWMRWSGQVWGEVDDSVPIEMARQYVLGEYAAAAAAGQRNDVTNWGRMLSRGRITSVVSLAKGIVRIEASQLDEDPDLLNTPGGIVDLRTGELSPCEPDRLMTKMTRVPYVPDAVHADWNKALEAVPEDVRDWLQLRLGQAVTGHMVPDDILLVNHGNGSNGKSAVLTGTSRSVGDYYVLVSDRVLMADPAAHPTELMDLMGVRFAALEETPEARRLDTQRLKRTIGTEQITARRIRQDSVVFDATHSLIINTNHRPEITETDHATWRRLALLRWPYTFRRGPEDVVSEYDRIGDPTLRDRCRTDPAIQTAALAWLVEGARRWYEADKVMPPLPVRVELDTLEWRKESDMALSFIQEHLVIDPESHVRTADVRDMLNRWLAAQGMHAWNDKTVTTRLGGHDEFTRHRIGKTFMRRNDRLSLPEHGPAVAGGADPFDGPAPEHYKAWTGVRWKTADDQGREGADQDHVSDVSADLVTPKRKLPARVTRSADTSDTSQVSGHDHDSPAGPVPTPGPSPEPVCDKIFCSPEIDQHTASCPLSSPDTGGRT